jgi:hypothetical protein
MAVMMPQLDQFSPASALTTFGELMEIFDIVSTKSQMQQGSSQVDSRHVRFASRKSLFDICASSLPPHVLSNL